MRHVNSHNESNDLGNVERNHKCDDIDYADKHRHKVPIVINNIVSYNFGHNKPDSCKVLLHGEHTCHLYCG